MQDLLDEDVIIVGCAGDDATSLPRSVRNGLDRFPAIWSSSAFPMIVAGAATNMGGFAQFSRGVDVFEKVIWAPGDDVECASITDSRDQHGSGTAFAAGLVGNFPSSDLLVL